MLPKLLSRASTPQLRSTIRRGRRRRPRGRTFIGFILGLPPAHRAVPTRGSARLRAVRITVGPRRTLRGRRFIRRRTRSQCKCRWLGPNRINRIIPRPLRSTRRPRPRPRHPLTPIPAAGTSGETDRADKDAGGARASRPGVREEGCSLMRQRDAPVNRRRRKTDLRRRRSADSVKRRLRLWWNWQTRYFEVVVGQPVQVQVLLSAP